MKQHLVGLLVVAFALPLFGAPAGFEDPALLERVMGGEVVQSTMKDTDLEAQVVNKAFFKSTSPESYMALATNFPKYPDLFEEVKEGRLLKESADHKLFHYELDISIHVGLFPFNQTAALDMTLFPGADAIAEGKIHNELLGFKDYIETGVQDTRLIPWTGGILVEDTVYIKLKKGGAMANTAKNKLTEFFGSYTEKMRAELQGDNN